MLIPPAISMTADGVDDAATAVPVAVDIVILVMFPVSQRETSTLLSHYRRLFQRIIEETGKCDGVVRK
jgi:hypothetical protein